MSLVVNHVICADPVLIGVVDRWQAIWGALRPTLDEGTRKTPEDKKKQWIVDYTVRCGFSKSVNPSGIIIEQVKACVAEKFSKWQAYRAKPTASGENMEAARRFLFDPAAKPQIYSTLKSRALTMRKWLLAMSNGGLGVQQDGRGGDETIMPFFGSVSHSQEKTR